MFFQHLPDLQKCQLSCLPICPFVLLSVCLKSSFTSRLVVRHKFYHLCLSFCLSVSLTLSLFLLFLLSGSSFVPEVQKDLAVLFSKNKPRPEHFYLSQKMGQVGRQLWLWQEIKAYSFKFYFLISLALKERLRQRFVCKHLFVFVERFRHLKSRRTAKSYAETERLNAALAILDWC